MSYYKHTNGEAFTLNGVDYVGYFNIIDDSVYTGRVKTAESELLSPKNTVIADFYKKGLEFDTTYNNISIPKNFYTNTFDLLNSQGMTDMLSVIDNNNLICFKNLVIGNPTVFKFEETGGHFFGLSSLPEELPDAIPPKYQLCNILSFEDSDNFKFLDSVHTGTLVSDTFDNFKYLCADNNALYVFSGNFTDGSNLKQLSITENYPYYNIIREITHDERYNKFYILHNDNISVYDSSNYSECDKLILEDQIKLPYDSVVTEYYWDTTDIAWDSIKVTWDTKYTVNNPNNTQFIKFGYNLRTGIDKNVLILNNKHSAEVIATVDLGLYNISNILDLDIRDTDDLVVILHKKTNGYYVFFYDLNTEIGENKPIYSLNDESTQNIKFEYHDSNVFSIYNTKEYQFRYISNPSYPSGRLETADLNYFIENYKWDTTDQLWNFFPILWDGVDLNSNTYNNLIVSTLNKNDKMYMILHNKGRIYVLNQEMNDRFMNFIPLDIEKFYKSVHCSETSLGLSFNLMISNILKDTLNLFNQSSSSYTLEERRIVLKNINNFILETENLYMNGNETMNVLMLQRILLLITDIQRKLLPSS